MSRKRFLILALLLLVIIGFFVVLHDWPQYAYAACREVMLDEDGYGAWELQSTRFLLFKAQFDFYDGFNTATCEAKGLGRYWSATKSMETLVACMLSLEDTGGNECPRSKFGVTP